MDIEQLLKELGATERALRELEASGEPRSAACWPAWRVALHKTNDPSDFQTWWEAHGSACPTCRATVRRVETDLAASGRARARPAPQVVGFLAHAPRSRALPWAASSPADIASPSSELPLVQYHAISDVCDPAIGAAWCVVWDNSLFILLVGPPEALARWQAGATLLNCQGEPLGDLTPVSGPLRDLLAPGDIVGQQPALCLQCRDSVAELQGQALTIPHLLADGIQLIPLEAGPSRVQELVADLTARNRVGRFLAGLPEEVPDPADRLTLNFYLRLLELQGRLTPPDRARLAALPWLAEDLRDALNAQDPTDG